MVRFIADKDIKTMIQTSFSILCSIVIVLGIIFKEDCPDKRNSKVIDIIRDLACYGTTNRSFMVHWRIPGGAKHETG